MKHMNPLFQLTLFIFALFPLAVNAATPSEPSVIGTVSHGGVVTVTGSGFGVKSPVAPLFWDPVDGMYSGVANKGVVPVGGSYPWMNNTGAVPVYFKTTNPRGKFTAKYTNEWSTNSNKKGGVGGNNYPGTKVLNVMWWMWVDKSGCTASTSNKWTRFTDDAGWNSTVQSALWTPALLDIYGVGVGNFVNWTSTCGKIGVWQRMEQLVDNTTTPIKPSVWYTVDNAPRGPQPFRGGASLLKDVTGIGAIGFDGSNTPAADQPTVDWGEIYVDNTRARVEICNASTKAASTHCEIQIPQTIWVDNQIQIKVNQGSFPDRSLAYLYVVDAGGNVSPGAAINFASSSGESDLVPPPPTGFSISNVTN